MDNLLKIHLRCLSNFQQIFLKKMDSLEKPLCKIYKFFAPERIHHGDGEQVKNIILMIWFLRNYFSHTLIFIFVGLKCFSHLRALFLMDEEKLAIDVLAKIINNANLTTFHELIWLL